MGLRSIKKIVNRIISIPRKKSPNVEFKQVKSEIMLHHDQ